MNDDERASFRRKMREFDSRAKARVDLALIDLRRIYESLHPDGRAEIKAWMEELVALANKMPAVGPLISIRVELTDQSGDDQDDSASVPILAFRNAFECWDRGEEYTPTKLPELIG